MNSNGDELHPNWRALATLHLPLKRFVCAGLAEGENEKLDKHKINAASGAEVSQFYKEVLEMPATKGPLKIKTESDKTNEKTKKTQMPFDRNKYFRLATCNNVEELAQMRVTNYDELNACDDFGWTALMMASCEGAVDSVKWLLQQGADTQVTDRSGATALDLAKRKKMLHIVQLFEYGQSQSEEVLIHEEPARINENPFYCEVCEREYTESSWSSHQASTVHLFNLKSLPSHKLHKFNISAKNRGLQLMVKQGWDREHGLGPTQSGRLYPIKTVLRKQRTGLGVEQPPARVTHFRAFDTNATRHRNGNPLPQQAQQRRTRNDMAREKVREWKRDRRLRNELS